MIITREEAITIIDSLHLIGCGRNQHEYDLKINVALDMAIEALENKPIPCERCIHVKSCRKVIILKNRTYKLIKYCSQGAERRKP